MPRIQSPHVQPGDLITSDFMNSLLDSIDALDARVSKLETAKPLPETGAGRPVLTSLIPANDLEVGDLLTLIGQNFTPLSTVRIHFSEQSFDDSVLLLGSSDTVLRLPVPLLSGLPKEAQITVSTSEGTSANALHAK